MLQPAILAESPAADLSGEIDRARRIGEALADPADRNIVQRYIAELETLIASGTQGIVSGRQGQPARH